MRARSGAVIAVVMLIGLAPALAQVSQGVPEGPLSDGAAAVARKPPSKPAKKARTKAAAVPSTRPPEAVQPPVALPTSRADRSTAQGASDPLTFGLKWQGSNDTAEKTRVQNYGGSATGTGAEVGLKLHF